MESYTHAKFLERLLAKFLDFNILSLSIALLFFMMTGHFSIDWRSSLTWDFFYVFYLVVTPLLWSGYVIGKRICKIKLKQTNGDNVDISNMIRREVVGFHLIGFLTLGLSLIASVFMVIFREDKRAIHDLIGGTYVAKADQSH
ncbi:RDD family protein [Piscibacillus halophilus]|uniref:RDD family protein n=1 Tax=Piscibacillus halophilus TaxID=571933 RepID=UPI00158EDC7B|nr:RDD family protein [Piscibacillus halophilus]